MEFFESSITFDKRMEDGITKRVTSQYVLNALSCTEAEAKTLECVKPYLSGDCSVISAKQSKITEAFRSEDGDGDWWKVKCSFITEDEKTGNEKRTPYLYIVQAIEIQEAIATFNRGMKGTMVDYDIESVSLTKIVDVFN